MLDRWRRERKDGYRGCQDKLGSSAGSDAVAMAFSRTGLTAASTGAKLPRWDGEGGGHQRGGARDARHGNRSSDVQRRSQTPTTQSDDRFAIVGRSTRRSAPTTRRKTTVIRGRWTLDAEVGTHDSPRTTWREGARHRTLSTSSNTRVTLPHPGNHKHTNGLKTKLCTKKRNFILKIALSNNLLMAVRREDKV